MVASAQWRTVRGECVEIDVPPDMAMSAAQGIEGPVLDLASPGLRLIVDCSPFADPLTSYEPKPGFERRREMIDDRQADVVSFTADDGTRVLGARLPGEVTAVVHAAPGTDPAIALRMLRSIRLPEGSRDG